VRSTPTMPSGRGQTLSGRGAVGSLVGVQSADGRAAESLENRAEKNGLSTDSASQWCRQTARHGVSRLRGIVRTGTCRGSRRLADMKRRKKPKASSAVRDRYPFEQSGLYPYSGAVPRMVRLARLLAAAPRSCARRRYGALSAGPMSAASQGRRMSPGRSWSVTGAICITTEKEAASRSPSRPSSSG
jgi:hypothetical protein